MQTNLKPIEIFQDYALAHKKVIDEELRLYGEEAYRIFIPNDRPGIETYYKGLKYPFKGWLFPNICEIVRITKRVVPEALRFLNSKWGRIIVIILVLLPRFIFNRIIIQAFENFTVYTHTALCNFYLRPERFCRSMREIYAVGMKVTEWEKKETLKESIKRFVLFVCMVLEFDPAYRFRFQDLAGIIDIELLKKNTRKEIYRVLSVVIEREKGGVKQKIVNIRKLVNIFLFLNKPYNSLILKMINETNLDEVKLDESDKYFCATRNDYDFEGKLFKQRLVEQGRDNPFDRK